MRASEVVARLQEFIDQGMDWEVVDDETELPVNLVEARMPPLQDRQDCGSLPHIVITQRGWAG